MDDMGDKFSKVQLAGKRLNLCGELGKGVVPDKVVVFIKGYLGGDQLTFRKNTRKATDINRAPNLSSPGTIFQG